MNLKGDKIKKETQNQKGDKIKKETKLKRRQN